MSEELERVYTINLGKVVLSPDNRRSKRAINMIRDFAQHHMKTKEVKIDQDLAHQVWERGIRSPPRKIRVKMTKTDEGYVLISPYEEELVEEEPKEKKKKLEKEAEEKIEEKETKEEPAEVKAEAKEVKEEKPKEVKAKKPKKEAKPSEKKETPETKKSKVKKIKTKETKSE